MNFKFGVIKKNQILASMVILMLVVAGYLNYTYDPTKNPAIVNIDEEKVINWLNKGAVPTDTVRQLLSKNGTMT